MTEVSVPEFNALVLAAGQGTRMKSSLPKVLHEAAGKTLVEHVLAALEPLSPARTVVVVGHGAAAVKESLAGRPVEFALQEQQLGTGHALMTTAALLEPLDAALLVLAADGPLITSKTLAGLLASRAGSRPGMSVLTAIVDDPTGLGRIVRRADGRIAAIVEHKDADAAQREIREINTGILAFDKSAYDFGRELRSDNAAGEYYITDLVESYLAAGLEVDAVVADDPQEALAVNDRAQLAVVTRVLLDRSRRARMLAGVTMLAPETTFVDDTVSLGRDVIIEPGVILRGATSVEDGCRIGAYSVLDDCRVSAGTRVAAHTVASGQHL